MKSLELICQLAQRRVVHCAVGFAVGCQALIGFADSGLEKRATWMFPTAESLQADFSNYVTELDKVSNNENSNDAAALIQRNWSDLSATEKGPNLLDTWIRLVAKLNPSLNDWVVQAQSQSAATDVNELKAKFEATTSELPAYARNNFQLFLGRYLTQRQLYDEAIEVLEPLTVEQVIDPSTLLFCKASAYHHLLKREECEAAIDTLLQRESEVVSRYAVLAKLMKADIQRLEEDSLDEIARLMNDVQRRLDLERSGKVVRDQETTIIEKLDKKIDEIEQQLQQQQQQQQQAQGQQQQQQRNASPMQDSQIAGGGGPGNVDKKDIGKLSGWGDLPPAQRQEALQKMTQDLPSHYREIIEAYFKQLASEGR